ELGLSHELLPTPHHRVFHKAVDGEGPLLLRHMRLNAEIKHRPALHQTLTRWQTIHPPVTHLAGEQTPLPRPLLLGLDELVFPAVVARHDDPPVMTRMREKSVAER